ncbi:MAG: hypothetical protein ACW981_00350 [Candidatus Hodarchaeales archaeon]|jgi:hypothetical protein
MAYKNIIDKFINAYDVLGIYLHDSGKIIPLAQKNPKGLLVIRENVRIVREGTYDFTYQNLVFGAIVANISEKTQIIVLTIHDKLDLISKQWKRVLPAIIKSLPVGEIIEEESPTTQIARISTTINTLFDEMITFYASQQKPK